MIQGTIELLKELRVGVLIKAGEVSVGTGTETLCVL